MRIFFIFLSMLFFSCSTGKTLPARETGGVPSGIWSHESRSTKSGVQIINRERWTVSAKGQRPVVAMDFYRMGQSVSGFPCNGAATYNIHMRFDFPDARTEGKAILLGKPRITHVPTTCDEKLPGMLDAVLMPHRGGRLLLVQGPAQEILHPFTLTGVWSYRRVTPTKGDIDSKIELEEWNLVQRPDRTVSGFYDRVVIRRSANRRPYSCNSKEEIWFFERYTVSGQISDNGTLTLKETGVQIPRHDACEPSGARYLDSFTGILAGDSIRIQSTEDKVEQTLERRYGLVPALHWGKLGKVKHPTPVPGARTVTR